MQIHELRAAFLVCIAHPTFVVSGISSISSSADLEASRIGYTKLYHRDASDLFHAVCFTLDLESGSGPSIVQGQELGSRCGDIRNLSRDHRIVYEHVLLETDAVDAPAPFAKTLLRVAIAIVIH